MASDASVLTAFSCPLERKDPMARLCCHFVSPDQSSCSHPQIPWCSTEIWLSFIILYVMFTDGMRQSSWCSWLDGLTV